MAGKDASTICSDRRSVRFMSPVTRFSLWDKTSMGQPVLLHINHYRKTKICVPEKILKLVQHQCENYGQNKHVLIGSLVVDDDGEGVQIQVDRLDTCSKCPTGSMDLAAGNVSISLEVTNNTANERGASVDDYIVAFQHLLNRCRSKDSIDLCSFLHLFGWGSFYSTAHTSVMHLDWDMVTMETTFKSTPVTPVPIVPTALSKNLTSPRSLSSMQGTPKTGYLTMDHTRKLLLVLESDPKAAVLPIIGIWVSGVELLHHPFVWAACLRFSHNTHLEDRVCGHPEQFLLVLYTPLHSRPEFYQCETSAGNTCLQFELSSGHDVINMDKELTSPGSGNLIMVEMEPAQPGSKIDIFDAAKLKLGAMTEVRASYLHGQEDLEPRCAPTPHSEKFPAFQPSVPDVSVLWAESYENHISCDELHKRQSVEVISQDPQEQFAYNDLFSRCGLSVLNRSTHPIVPDSMGELHHPKYSLQSHTMLARPLLSHHYSPSGQNGQPIPLSVSDFSLPCHRPGALHSQNIHDLSVPGHVSAPSVYARASTPSQHPPVTPPPLVGSSDTVSWTHFTTGSSSNGYHHHPNTPTVIHSMHQSLPLSHTWGSSREALDRNQDTLHAHYPQHTRSKLIQHSDNSQLVAGSSSRFGQDDSTSSEASVVTAKRQSPTTILQPSAVSQHLQPFTSRECLHHRATLKTITEETSSAPSSSTQTLYQYLEKDSENTDILEPKYVDPEGKVPNRSPPHCANSNNSHRPTREDSGFSVTPDRLSKSVAEHEIASLATAVPCLSTAVTAAGPMHVSVPNSLLLQSPIDNIQWEQIPAQIRVLLIQQHEQLQQLQQQVHMLQSQQLPQPKSVLSPHKVSDVITTRSQNLQPIPCSSGDVNTIFCDDLNNSEDGHILTDSQTSQDTSSKDKLQQEQFLSPLTYSKQTVDSSPVAVISMDQVASHSPQRSSHSSQAHVQQNDKQLDDAAGDVHVFDQTRSMDLSELVVDMPEYVSSINDRSQIDESPSSVSDYYRQSQEDSYSSLGEDAADPKQYYSQLMKNIQTFLTNSGSQDYKCSSPVVAWQADTDHRMTLSRLESPASSTIVPDVSSVSMLLGCGSDSWHSMEMNALAMKYLSDEQLTCMAKLCQSTPSKQHKSACSTKVLQQVFGACHTSLSDNTSTPDVSRLGISPSDMTLGTLMYLEKHGLLGNDRSVMDQHVMGHELQLRTDFSILANTSTAAIKTDNNFSTNGGGHYNVVDAEWFQQTSSGSDQACMSLETAKSPALPSGLGQTAALTNNENWLPQKKVLKDLAASPVLPLPKIYIKNKTVKDGGQLTTSDICQQNVLQEVKPQAVANARTRASNSPTVSPIRVEGDEENLLDIGMLKQMPKLL